MENENIMVKQELIDKYLANETSKEEERQLRRLLIEVPVAERSKQEAALLLMLTPMQVEYTEDILSEDYSKEYFSILQHRRTCYWRYVALTTIAVAASVVLVVLFGWNYDTEPSEQPKQAEAVSQQIPTEKEMTKKTIQTSPLQLSQGGENQRGNSHHKPTTSSSYYSPPSQGGAKGVGLDPHYAWAHSLINSYHEDEAFSKSIAMKDKEPSLKEGIEVPTSEVGTEWAANDIHKDMTTIKAKGERLRKRIEELQN